MDNLENTTTTSASDATAREHRRRELERLSARAHQRSVVLTKPDPPLVVAEREKAMLTAEVATLKQRVKQKDDQLAQALAAAAATLETERRQAAGREAELRQQVEQVRQTLAHEREALAQERVTSDQLRQAMGRLQEECAVLQERSHEQTAKLEAVLNESRQARASSLTLSGSHSSPVGPAVALFESQSRANLVTGDGLENLPFEVLLVVKQQLSNSLRIVDELLEDRRAEERLCVVCSENAKNTVLRPCGHMTMCDQCAGRVDKCPNCRAQIVERLRVFT